MSIRDKENALFAEWKKHRKHFVEDGAVSEKDYLNSNPKIAFILKEANDENGGGWDLRKMLNAGDGYANIARWVIGIRKRKSDLDWKNFKSIQREAKKEAFKSIVFMNLKKSAGGSTANDKELAKVAKEDKEYVQKQYALYDPDLTICCGGSCGFVGGLFGEVVGHKSEWKQTKRGVWWYETSANKYVLCAAHPAVFSVRGSLLLYELADAVNELMPA